MSKKIKTTFQEKTISALRVLDKLEPINCPCLKQHAVLKTKKSYIEHFFVVNNNWKQELKENKKVSVVAEVTASKL